MGTAIKSGYQSNYVLTDRDGVVADAPTEDPNFFDEIVLSLESQVVPLFLVYVVGNR